MRLECVGKVKANYVKPRGLHTGSIIIFSNAAGHSPLALVILPAQFGTSAEKVLDIVIPDLHLPLSHNTKVHAFTECGRMTKRALGERQGQFPGGSAGAQSRPGTAPLPRPAGRPLAALGGC